jgi:hypothetical protein
VTVLFDEPSRTFLEEPDANCNRKTRDHLKRERESPCWQLYQYRSWEQWLGMLTLKITVNFETTISKPLRNEESPRQHELQQAAEFAAILGGGNLRLLKILVLWICG